MMTCKWWYGFSIAMVLDGQDKAPDSIASFSDFQPYLNAIIFHKLLE